VDDPNLLLEDLCSKEEILLKERNHLDERLEAAVEMMSLKIGFSLNVLLKSFYRLKLVLLLQLSSAYLERKEKIKSKGRRRFEIKRRLK